MDSVRIRRQLVSENSELSWTRFLSPFIHTLAKRPLVWKRHNTWIFLLFATTLRFLLLFVCRLLTGVNITHRRLGNIDQLACLSKHSRPSGFWILLGPHDLGLGYESRR